MSAAGRVRTALEERAARAYVARDRDEALALGRRLGAAGVGCTLGYWDGPGAPGRAAVTEIRAALAAVDGLDAVVAVKAPPLLADRAPATAAQALAPDPPAVRLVVDAPAPDAADGALALALALADCGCDAGIALPGRWRRSVADAEVAVERGLAVRLVKGEHADPAGDGPEAAQGFVALARQLAGRARHVGVASHDPATAGPAIAALRAAGTSCELELLLGLPVGADALAREPEIGVRVYVPWGTRAWVPYEATDRALLCRLLADAAVGERRWKRTLELRGAAAPRPHLSRAA